jgi:hypothetical protein
MISIGEGTINIPAAWHNASVNIFSANPEGGLNISINRDQLSGQTTLSDYANGQIETITQHLAQFKLLHQQTLPLGVDPAHSHSAILFEFSWHSPELGLMHQIIMCAAQGKKVLNFTGSQPGMMDTTQRQTILASLASFSFNAPA